MPDIDTRPRHILVINLHHIITDGWSVQVMIQLQFMLPPELVHELDRLEQSGRVTQLMRRFNYIRLCPFAVYKVYRDELEEIGSASWVKSQVIFITNFKF
jgi:hypothetical protein